MSDYSGWGQYTTGAQSQLYPPQQGQVSAAGYTIDGQPLAPDYTDQSRIYGFNQALSQGLVNAGPQMEQSQQYREQLANQLAMVNASQTTQSGYLNQDYNTGLSRLGLQQDRLGIDKSALDRQSPYLSNLHDLAQQLFGLNRTSANQSADVSRRGLDSTATARGAFTSIGANQGRGDIQNQLANQLAGIDIQSGQETARYNENVASLADQNKALDLQAKDLGLSRDALKTELDRGLDRLGLSTSMSVSDLSAKMSSSNIQDQVLAQQIWNAAINASDYFSQFYTPPTAPSGGAGTQGSITRADQGLNVNEGALIRR